MSVTTTLWEHKNFGGQMFTSNTQSGRYFWNTWGKHNDFFSSMRAWANGHRGNAYAFEHIDFSGRFAALNVGGQFSSSWWSYFGDAFNDKVSSSLVVAREPQDIETEVALRSIVTPQFTSLFDARTAGTPLSRKGDPRVYGTFFPDHDKQLVFATIHQDLSVKVRIPLKITIPNPFGDDVEIDLGQFRWSDYSANVRYDILFFVTRDGVLHGRAKWSHVWVEAGPFSQKVYDEIAPGLHGAKSALTSAIEGGLALFNRRRRFADAYVLPGTAPDMNQSGFFANYDDDVVLVAVTRR
ncbi:hypothetical protein [Sandaracinus amylolyticus]|uniref:hypothetical protein n=1 Tax=Sandaracinus amylolyticus TaxID=927083 RepID=UPI001F48C979|nr:hypothetical protein [Sandaracinus amylolyticus]UJR84199.1 Hypothetical protein I5071_62700 [Sandaracinus amylolyticus]